MKAWEVRDEYEEYSAVVFAETRNKARLIAQCLDVCEDMRYIDIRPRRFKEADSMYRGSREMDWFDTKDRRFLVDHGWSCVEPIYEHCLDCPASDICDKYSDYKRERKKEDE